MTSVIDTTGGLHGMIKPYVLNDEEKCALIDIHRYNDATAVAEGFRNDLLRRLATAAVTSLYGTNGVDATADKNTETPFPSANNIDNFPPAHGPDPSNNELALVFISLASLPKR